MEVTTDVRHLPTTAIAEEEEGEAAIPDQDLVPTVLVVNGR